MAAAMGNMVWQRRPRLAKLKLEGFPAGGTVAHDPARELPAARRRLPHWRALRPLRPAAARPRARQRHQLPGRLLAWHPDRARQPRARHRRGGGDRRDPGYLAAGVPPRSRCRTDSRRDAGLRPDHCAAAARGAASRRYLRRCAGGQATVCAEACEPSWKVNSAENGKPPADSVPRRDPNRMKRHELAVHVLVVRQVARSDRRLDAHDRHIRSVRDARIGGTRVASCQPKIPDAGSTSPSNTSCAKTGVWPFA